MLPFPLRVVRRAFAAAALAAALGAVAPSAGWATTGTVKEFTLPTATAGSYGVTLGPDGNVWFTEHGLMGGANPTPVGRITPDGTITEFAADPGASPNGITSGPNGNLWFSDPPNSLGEMTPSGTFTVHGGIGITGDPRGIAMGPDHNIYVVVADPAVPKILEVPPAGTTSTPIAIPDTTANPQEITVGPDGNMWFTELNSSKIGRVNLNVTPHTITEFPITVIGSPAAPAAPRGIVAAPDGNIWFTETGGGISERLGHISTSGTNYGQTDLLTGGATDPEGLTVGPDNALWFVAANGSQVARATTTDPALTQFGAGITPNSMPRFIARGADGNMWFSEEFANKIARITVDPPTPPAVTPPVTTPTPTPTPPDTIKPVVSKLTLKPSRFVVGTKTTAVSAAAKTTSPTVGTTISYTLSEPASVALKIQRASSGRRVGRSCVRATHANRKAVHCTRYTSAGTLKRTGVKGANRVAFSGRVGAHALTRGSYRLSATATDAAGNVSKTASAAFSILTPPKKHKH